MTKRTVELLHYGELSGLQYRSDVDALVRRLSEHLCVCNGLDAHGSHDVCVGYADDGSPVVAQVANTERFEEDVRALLDYLFIQLDPISLISERRMWKEFKRAELEIAKRVDDAEDSPALVNKLLED